MLMMSTPRSRCGSHTLSGLCLIGLVLSGCANGSPAVRGYYNEPLGPVTASHGQSGAYLASTHAPWCVNLGHPGLTLDQVRSLRKAFYEVAHEHGGEGQAVPPSPGPAHVSGLAARAPSRRSCWALVQHTGARITEEAHDRDVVALALPGGGSRSAVFSAAVMFELQREGLLRKVDLISAVSGGSIPAALFARSCEHDAECRVLYGAEDRLLWVPAEEERIFDLLTTDFLRRAILKMTLPWNQLLYRTTRYDRTDTMAEVFASTLFGVGEEVGAYGMRFRHLNPRRPNVVLNGMNSTGRNLGGGLRGQHFLFSVETFEGVLRSDLHEYPLALAVVGSGAFPGAFHPLTLAAFPGPAGAQGESDQGTEYLHIVDGGLYDRLGGEAIRHMLQDLTARERPCVGSVDRLSTGGQDDCLERVILIILDSGLPFEGEDAGRPDVRIPVFDLFVNHNIKMASLTLLEIQAELRLNALKAFIREQNDAFRRGHGMVRDLFTVVDLRLRDVEHCVRDPLPCARAEGVTSLSEGEAAQRYEDLWREVAKVPLSLHISQESAAALRRAARILVRNELREHCLPGGVPGDCPGTPPHDPHDPLHLYTGSPPR